MRGRLYRPMLFVVADVILVEGFGLKFSCWLSTVDMWQGSKLSHPHAYTYSGDFEGVHIRSNFELTVKMVNMIGEFAETETKRVLEVNNKRKIENLGKKKAAHS